MDRMDFYQLEKGKDLDANGNSALTILRKLSECERVFAPPFEMAPRLKAMRVRIAIPKRFPPRRADRATYSTLQTRCKPSRTCLFSSDHLHLNTYPTHHPLHYQP